MQVAIYATEEKRRRAGFDHVLVLARLGEALILRRDRINALWVLPEGRMTRGQSVEETARSALGAACLLYTSAVFRTRCGRRWRSAGNARPRS